MSLRRERIRCRESFGDRRLVCVLYYTRTFCVRAHAVPRGEGFESSGYHPTQEVAKRARAGPLGKIANRRGCCAAQQVPNQSSDATAHNNKGYSYQPREQ
jgi:hypothetical protein